MNGHTKKTHPNQWWLLHPKIAKRKYGTLLKRGKGGHGHGHGQGQGQGQEANGDEVDIIQGEDIDAVIVPVPVITNTIGTNSIDTTHSDDL